MRAGRVSVAVMFAVCAVAVDLRAEGETPGVTAHLGWSAPAGCPEASSVKAATESLLGRRVFVERDRADVLVTGVFERGGDGGWVAQLRLLSREGSVLGVRVLHSPDTTCAATEGPVSLVMSMLLDRKRKRVEVRLPPPPPEPEPRWGLQSAAGARVIAGILPKAAAGPHLGMEVVPPVFVPFRLDLTVLPETESATDGVGGRFSAWYGGLALCPELIGEARVRAALCAAGQVGSLAGVGTGLDVTRSPHRFYAHGEAYSRTTLVLAGPLVLELGAGATVPLRRPRFELTRADGSTVEVHRPDAVGLFAQVGLGFRMGD